MQITETKVNASDFCKHYSGDGYGGVMGVPIMFFDKYDSE